MRPFKKVFVFAIVLIRVCWKMWQSKCQQLFNNISLNSVSHDLIPGKTHFRDRDESMRQYNTESNRWYLRKNGMLKSIPDESVMDYIEPMKESILFPSPIVIKRRWKDFELIKGQGRSIIYLSDKWNQFLLRFNQQKAPEVIYSPGAGMTKKMSGALRLYGQRCFGCCL